MLKFASTSVFLRCTIDDAQYRDQIKTQLAKGYLTNFIGDVLQAREIIFGYGVGLSILLSFVWVTLLRFECLSLLFIWGSIFGVQALFVIMTIVAYLTANSWADQNPQIHNNQEIRGIRCLSAICLGLAVIWLILSCAWRSAINLAVKTMALTAECIEDMPLIVITPVVQAIGVVCFVVSHLVVDIHVISMVIFVHFMWYQCCTSTYLSIYLLSI
jgi:hypothetical protein